MRLFRLRHGVRSSLWLVPLLCLATGVGLSFLTVAIDRAADHDLVSRSLTGTPTGVQTTLSTIATSVVTLAGLVLSLTLVAVQLAMGQFSPRIVRALLTDRRSQLAIGLLLATFAYVTLAMRAVHDGQDGGAVSVPGVTVLVAYAMAVLSIVGLLLYVHHAGQSLRVGGLIDLVGDELRAELDRRYPGGGGPGGDEPGVIASREPGVVFRLDPEGIVSVARRQGCALELVPMMGDFVCAGAPLFRTTGPFDARARAEVTRLVHLGRERSHPGDPAYGFRKLVDIAERAISDPFDDPTTAVAAIDRLHDCLRQLAGREFPSGEHRDAGGELRLVTRVLDWDGYVRLAFDEVRLAGARSPQVARRLRAALEDLVTVAAPGRRPPLERQLELLENAVRREFEDAEDVSAALVPDQQGIGAGADLVREPDSVTT